MGRSDKRKYQRNCAFSFKRKRATWNTRKDKTMTLDTQINLAESDKGSFYNKKEWLEKYEYGKGLLYSECSDDLRASASIFSNKFAIYIYIYFFFYLGFLSRTLTIHMAAGEGGGYLFNSSLLLPPTSRTLRH